MRIIAVSSPLKPTEYFNNLSEEQKKQVMSDSLGPLLLNSGLNYAVPMWWIFNDQEAGFKLRNGSAFLVDLGQGIFAVTAAHVFRGYVEAKAAAVAIGCQLGDALFDPEAQLICCRDDLDIATFRVTESDVDQIGKSIVTSGPPNWEPLNPEAGNFAFFAGFPAQTRGVISGHAFATAPYFAMPAITSVTDHQIVCRFDWDKSISFGESGFPPQAYDIGGVSGGPMLMPTLVCGGVIWRFAGVIVQAAAGEMFEGVVAVRAHYIHADGRIG
jgi:hypothetical protein